MTRGVTSHLPQRREVALGATSCRTLCREGEGPGSEVWAEGAQEGRPRAACRGPAPKSAFKKLEVLCVYFRHSWVFSHLKRASVRGLVAGEGGREVPPAGGDAVLLRSQFVPAEAARVTVEGDAGPPVVSSDQASGGMGVGRTPTPFSPPWDGGATQPWGDCAGGPRAALPLQLPNKSVA